MNIITKPEDWISFIVINDRNVARFPDGNMRSSFNAGIWEPASEEEIEEFGRRENK